jgi:hypothetical protein
MHKENVTYQLVPGEEGDQHWLVRIIDGVFNECVIQYGSISINEEKEDEMNFNFFVESSPDPELTSENPELQEEAGEILQAIITDALKDGSAVIEDKI